MAAATAGTAGTSTGSILPSAVAALPPMHAELQIHVQQVSVVLAAVEEHAPHQRQPQQEQQQQQQAAAQQERWPIEAIIPMRPTAPATAAAAAEAASRQASQQPAAARHLEDTVRLLRQATASNSLEAAASLQQQLAAALAAVDAADSEASASASRQQKLRQAAHPHFVVHPFAELHLELLQASRGLTDGSRVLAC